MKINLRTFAKLIALASMVVCLPLRANARTSVPPTLETMKGYWTAQKFVEYELPEDWQLAPPDFFDRYKVVDVVSEEARLTLTMSEAESPMAIATLEMQVQGGKKCIKTLTPKDKDADDVRGACASGDGLALVRAKRLANGKIFVGRAGVNSGLSSSLTDKFHEFMDGVRAPVGNEKGRRQRAESARLHGLITYELPIGYTTWFQNEWPWQVMTSNTISVARSNIKVMGDLATPRDEMQEWYGRHHSKCAVSNGWNSDGDYSYGSSVCGDTRSRIYVKRYGKAGTVSITGEWYLSEDEVRTKEFDAIVASVAEKRLIEVTDETRDDCSIAPWLCEW